MVGRKKAGALVGSDNLKPKKEKKAKEGPKRPLSSYILFCNDKREQVAAEGFKGRELMKEMGVRWRALDEEEKKPYVRASEEARAQAEEERNEAEEASKKGKRSKSPGKGKAATSRSLSPPKGKAKAADESMGEEKKAKRGRKKC